MEDDFSQIEMNLGNVQSVLVIAKRCNVRKDLLELPTESKDNTSKQTTSLELICLLKEISELKEEYYTISNDIHRLLLNQESFRYVHPSSLTSKSVLLNSLLEYFSVLVSNIGNLVTRLQNQQSLGPAHSLKMKASYQREFAELLLMFTKLLNNFSSYMSSIKYLKEDFNFKNDIRKINKFSAMIQALMECKRFTQILQDHAQLQQKE